MNKGEMVPQKIGSIGSYKVEDLLRAYFVESSGLAVSSLKAKRYDLGLFLSFYEQRNGHVDLRTWLPVDTATFRAELLRDGYAPATINRVLATLRSFGSFGRDLGAWPLNPCKGVKDLQLPPPQPKALPEPDYYRVVKAAELLAQNPTRKYDESHRNRALVAVLASSGLRISEALTGLRLSHVQGRKLVGVLCKGGKVRDVLISKEAARLLEDYVANHRTPGSEFLFTNRYGGPLSRNGAARALERIARVASPKGQEIRLNPHAFRHRVGKIVRTKAGDVAAARKLGHASTRLIELYATTTEAEDERLTDELI